MKRTVSVMVVALAPMAVAAGNPAVITLRAQATVSSAHVLLADIADVRGADAMQRERLGAIKIAPAPAPGTRRTVTAKDVAQRLARATETKVVVEGSSTTTIERPVAEYAGVAFIDAARDFVRMRLAEQHPELSRVEVIAAGDFPAVRGPAGEWRLIARATRGDALAKRVSVWIDLEVDGAVYRSLPVWVGVSAYRPVMVAQRAYRSKESLAASHFAVEERDIAGLRETPLPVGTSLDGLRARRALFPGAIVQAGDVEARPSVVADEEIDVQLRAGPIAINTRAIAEEEGSEGAYIRVRNPASALTYTARVVDRGQALVTDR